jgi:hypothetical protein
VDRLDLADRGFPDSPPDLEGRQREGTLPGTRMGRVQRSADIRAECWALPQMGHSYRDRLLAPDRDILLAPAYQAYTAAPWESPVPVVFALGRRGRPDLRRCP